jgi:hypothetical protein
MLEDLDGVPTPGGHVPGAAAAQADPVADAIAHHTKTGPVRLDPEAIAGERFLGENLATEHVGVGGPSRLATYDGHRRNAPFRIACDLEPLDAADRSPQVG